MAGIKLCICVCSVVLVACSRADAAWTRSRGNARTRHGRKVGGPGVAIVQNIHTTGEDGSYTYGWKASDGSFKKETRLASGEVFGEYGYKDASGDLIRTKYGVNKNTQFGFKILSNKKRNLRARQKINKKEKKRSGTKETPQLKNKGDTTDNASKTSHKIEVIDGRKAVIDKRARQLLTKEDIIKSRKAFIDNAAKNLLKKLPENQMIINGKKVKIVRKPRKQNIKKGKNSSRDVKVMKDKHNNHLRTANADKHKVEKFDIQMTLPHPMMLKPRSLKPKEERKAKFSPEIIKSNSRVPYYTAFILAKRQAKLKLKA